MTIAAEAQRLLQAHGGLLKGEASPMESSAQREAVAALDAAQARLRGGERSAADQMALDLRAR